MKTRARFITVCLVLSLGIFAHTLAWAQLGEDESTVELDRQAMHGVHQMTARQTHRVHEITTEGNTVKEYAAPNGSIFAVTWCGISHPDFSQIFGNYFSEFHQADQAIPAPRGRAPKQIKTANLMGVRYGHMRSVCGKVLIPSLVPPGFDPTKDLQ